MIKRHCPNCNNPWYIQTIIYLEMVKKYQNECATCGWKTKKTRFAWQADRAWNRGKAEVENAAD